MSRLEIHQLDQRYASLRIAAPPSRQARMVSSLRIVGQQTPVLVHEDEDRSVLIDGYLRVEGLGVLAEDVVEASVVKQSIVDALILGFQLSASRPKSILEEAWMLDELSRCHGESLGTLAAKLDRSASWVSRRLSLVRVLPTSVQDAVRQGRLSPQAAMRSLVPLARANAEHCTRLVTNLGRRTVYVRELDRLYRGWLRSPPDVQEQIVAQPALFLAAESTVNKSNPDALIRELQELTSRSTRIRKMLNEAPSAYDETVAGHRKKAVKAFEALDDLMKEKLHAGS